MGIYLRIAAPNRYLGRYARIFQQENFHHMLTFERRRAERSRKQFALMLLNAGTHLEKYASSIMPSVASVVSRSIRETDLVGWYENGTILGVVFTEINQGTGESVIEVLRSRVVSALAAGLNHELASRLVITVHLYPEKLDGKGINSITDARLYPDLSGTNGSKRHLGGAIKRLIDISASTMFLVVLSPLFVAIALLIKLTSKGAVIFQQERLGQLAVPFKLLKFRTMYVNNDSTIHRDYVQRYIGGQSAEDVDDSGAPLVYKLTKDPRVTPIGKFLRKTSLDELPQLWNVIVGNMSLVGPRPPLPYEFEIYDVWHRRRVLEIRPGITGLWQVSGRSRICFDEMVRLDLRYSQSWSLWLDLKILAATPRAVFGGDGAY